MSTIVKTFSHTNARSDGCIHWQEDRVASLEELRRFQGVPDNFILVGSRNQQIGLIGNSVTWASSSLLGRELTKSWNSKPFVYDEPTAAKLWKNIQGHKSGVTEGNMKTSRNTEDDLVMLESDDEFEHARSRRELVIKIPPRRIFDPNESTARTSIQRLVSVDIPSVAGLNLELGQELHTSTPIGPSRSDYKRTWHSQVEESQDSYNSDSDTSLPDLKTLFTPSRSSSETIEVRPGTPIGTDSGYSSQSHLSSGSRRRKLLAVMAGQDRDASATPSKRPRISSVVEEQHDSPGKTKYATSLRQNFQTLPDAYRGQTRDQDAPIDADGSTVDTAIEID